MRSRTTTEGADMNFETFIDIEDGDINCGVMHMDDDAARTIYFALAEYRDKLVADIASYHKMVDKHIDLMCSSHTIPNGGPDPFCPRCQKYHEAKDEYDRRHATQDEDLHFLGDALNKVCRILFEMGANNTKDYQNWLSV
jgi:hypothetical protein